MTCASLLAVASALLSRVRLEFVLELRLFVWLSLLLWSASVVLPASSLVAYRLHPVLYGLCVSLRAACSTFLPCPYHFLILLRVVRPTFSSRSCHFPALSRVVRPTLPFVRPISQCVVRYSFSISSCSSRLLFCPVPRFLCSLLFLFFPGHYCTRRTILLLGALLGKPLY